MVAAVLGIGAVTFLSPNSEDGYHLAILKHI